MASRNRTEAEVSKRKRGYSKCPFHDTEVVVLACINCGGELVCATCISTRHERHQFENISKVADRKKTKIQEFVQKVEKSQLPTITNNLQYIDQQIKETTNHFKKLQKQIVLQGENMKEEIDRITKDLVEKCKVIEQQNSELLSKYKKDLENLHTTLNQAVKKCKDTLRADNNILTIDVEKDTQREFKPPNSPKYTIVTFTAGPESSKHLQDDFGSLYVKEGQMLVPQESHHAPGSDTVKHYRSNDSTVESEFTHSTGIWSVEKSTSDSVWLSYYKDKYISRVTLQGEVKQNLELGSNIWDISVSPATGNLWLCCNDKVVYEVSGNKPTKRFTVHHIPLSLCMTPDNNVVVATVGSVRVYSTTGQVLHSIQGSDSVVFPRHITECTSTGDIGMCDIDSSRSGGKDKPHVSVFNSKLVLKYQYYGPPASVMESDFYPIDVVYDTQGHLLILDRDNKCIQLVSGEGQFLTVVHADTLQPTALTLIQDGLLRVGFNNKKVKVIRYSV